MNQTSAHIRIQDLTMAYGDFVVQEKLTFTINRGDIFIIMGGSGCGKSSLLKHMIGLKAPEKGRVYYGDIDFWESDQTTQEMLKRRFGVLYQSGALWSSMTLAENVALPLSTYTDLDSDAIADIVALKLALVGLSGFEDYLPSEISGGMRKRAGLARAIALDPKVMFFDEPSAGLDPVSAHLLDDLIVELRESMGATVVIVTHELASIFAIGNNSVFLDTDTKTMLATGDPKALLAERKDPKIIHFLTRGQSEASGPSRSKSSEPK